MQDHPQQNKDSQRSRYRPVSDLLLTTSEAGSDPSCPGARRGQRRALSAGGADLGVGDLVGEQGVGLGGFGGGVAEASPYDLDGDSDAGIALIGPGRARRVL